MLYHPNKEKRKKKIIISIDFQNLNIDKTLKNVLGFSHGALYPNQLIIKNMISLMVMFGSWEVLKKEKKILRKNILLYLVMI